MFESIINFFKRIGKQDKEQVKSKDAAKERLHLVLMQDRANVSADFLDLMKQEIIEVIKKYIDVDENAIDVRLTNKENDDGTKGAPALYANIPIVSIKEEVKTGIARQKDTSKGKKDAKKGEEKEVVKKKIEEQKPENQKEKVKEEAKQTENKKQKVEESKKEVLKEEPKNKEVKQNHTDKQEDKKEEEKNHKQQEESKQQDAKKDESEEEKKAKKEGTTKK